MKKENKETTYTTCHCEKSSLPSIRVRIKGEVKALLKPLKIKGFKRRKDNTSPLGRLCCLRNTRRRTASRCLGFAPRSESFAFEPMVQVCSISSLSGIHFRSFRPQIRSQTEFRCRSHFASLRMQTHSKF